MASSDSESSPPPSLEELTASSATTLLLPWILSATNSGPREIAVFLHQSTRSITVIEGSLDIESILYEFACKEGPLPASKASIDSLPRVQVLEPGLECPICLSEYEVKEKEEVKEMPCRHRFHSGCIVKWLGIHGSCPVCRFGMPVEEKIESEETEREGWRIHVFFSRGRRESGMNVDSGRDGVADSGDDEFP
ncbi:hypothetical protein ACJIZ3_002069 [Penstemon smallii]|uniref:RING-type E3 ubiquitin transferase n=1 Tax=Penstemon smallii TaxID=265156 RepID=A0ABD3U798_9LAMI